MSDQWVIMPWLNAPEMTWTAVENCLAQSLPGVRVLLIDQGASREDRAWIDAKIDVRADHRVLSWHYLPMLPSLSAVWNRALAFVWDLGGTEALVVNNDVRLHRETYDHLASIQLDQAALFVSAVGVQEDQFDPGASYNDYPACFGYTMGTPAKGGPDFSCFLISKEAHQRYPFDEAFVPAFCEDLDAHRRYMLGGDGDKIFSVNLPFLHYASQTIKRYSPEQRHRFNQQYAQVRAYYKAKWGGEVNEETYRAPFNRGLDPTNIPDGLVTTPDLQRYWQVARRPTDGQE